MKFLDSLPPPTEAELQQFEAQIGAPLPAQYRQFLLEHNGATPEPSDIEVPKWGGSILKTFYALAETGSWTLKHYLKLYRDRIPQQFIPIISDAAGNAFVLGISGKYTGQIWFWDHEGEADEGEKPTFKNMYKVAPDFQTFLSKIYEYQKEVTDIDQLVATGSIPEFKAWLAQGNDINAPIQYYETLFSRVLLRKPPAFAELEWLIQQGASMEGSIAKAYKIHEIEVLEWLVEKGANLNENPKNTYSALESAIISVKPEHALKLLKIGADPRNTNKLGRDAFDLVEVKIRQGNQGLEEVRQAILTRMADFGNTPFWEQPLPKPTQDELTDWQTEKGIELPDEYCRFLCTYNGGIPHPSLWKIEGFGSIWVAKFYPFSSNSETSTLQSQNPDPRKKGWLTIGEDRQGNLIQMWFANRITGQIRLELQPKQVPKDRNFAPIQLFNTLSDGLHQFHRGQPFPDERNIKSKPTLEGFMDLARFGWEYPVPSTSFNLILTTLKLCGEDLTLLDELLRTGMKVDFGIANAIRVNSLPAIKLFLAYGADPEEKMGRNHTALILATMQNAQEIANHLLDIGANPHAIDGTGKSALDYATEWLQKGDPTIQSLIDRLEK